MSADQKELVDDLLESILGDDHVRLADVLFEMVKSDEHYRVLAKHHSKRSFVLRYIDRLIEPTTTAAQAPPVEAQTVDARPCSEDFDYVGGPQEETVDARPCADDFDYVGAPQETSASVDAHPCSDDFEYVGSGDAVATGVMTSAPVQEEETGELVELRARGSSAEAEELPTLGPREVINADASPSEGMVELRPRGNTAELGARIAAMDVEEPVSPMRLERKDPSPPPVLETEAQVAKELKEVARPVELADFSPEAAPANAVKTSSLFSPPKKGPLFGNTHPDIGLAPTSFSAAGVAQNRLKKLAQAEETHQAEDEEGELRLASSSGVEATRAYNPQKNPAGTIGNRWGDGNIEIDMPTLHAGIAGNYKRDSESTKWTQASHFE